jgi:hypothetical protein
MFLYVMSMDLAGALLVALACILIIARSDEIVLQPFHAFATGRVEQFGVEQSSDQSRQNFVLTNDRKLLFEGGSVASHSRVPCYYRIGNWSQRMM